MLGDFRPFDFLPHFKIFLLLGLLFPPIFPLYGLITMCIGSNNDTINEGMQYLTQSYLFLFLAMFLPVINWILILVIFINNRSQFF